MTQQEGKCAVSLSAATLPLILPSSQGPHLGCLKLSVEKDQVHFVLLFEFPIHHSPKGASMAPDWYVEVTLKPAPALLQTSPLSTGLVVTTTSC